MKAFGWTGSFGAGVVGGATDHRYFTSHGHLGLIAGFAWSGFPEEVIGGRPFKAFFPS
jgi:hypothetical protein